MKNRKGFTLAEIMVSIAVLGILSAILIPVIVKKIPDNSKVLIKSSYASVENAVTELINDQQSYPMGLTGTTTDIPPKTVELGLNNTSLTGTNVPSGQNKFCYLLTQEMNVVNTTSHKPDCNAALIAGRFSTTNDMDWWVYYNPPIFPLKADGYTTRIVFDIKFYNLVGKDISPNCGTGDHIMTACAAGITPDRCEVGVRYDGKIKMISSDCAALMQNPQDNTKR